MPYESDNENENEWSISDIWLGLLFVGTGALVTVLAVLAVRKGQSWAILMVGGLGGFLVGPTMVLIGVNAVVRSLLSLRTRNRCSRCGAAAAGNDDRCAVCGAELIEAQTGCDQSRRTPRRTREAPR